jgi:PhnB protein
MTLQPYRFFSNNCREAMTRYQEIFGGQLEVMAFGDMPPGEDAPEGIDPDLVMHAALIFSDGSMLMASDDPSGDGGPVKGVSLHHTAATIDEGEALFAQLAEGGEIGMPFEEVFWALRFGDCTDRFGTSWMVSVDHPT